MSIRRLIAGLSLVVTMFCGANASATDVIIKSADVPFDFVVRGQMLPAGKYTILRADMPPDVLVLRNDRTHESVLTLSFPEDKTSTTARLVFDTVDGANVLRAVITSSSYSSVPVVNHKKRMAQMTTPGTMGR